MKRIKVGAVVLNQTPLDWDGNQSRIEAALRAAQSQGVGFVVLPELCTSGYGCEDAFLGLGVAEASAQLVAQVAPLSVGSVVCLGLPFFFRGGLYNCVCVLVDGVPAGLVAKQTLAGDGIHYEPRWFKPWPRGVRAQTTFLGREVPLGDIFFDVAAPDLHSVRVGFEICEDAWAGDRRSRDLFDLGIDIIANPSASHFAFGKHTVRKQIVCEGARALAATSVYANLLGNEAGRVIYDGGALIAHNGDLVASGPRFGFETAHLTTAVVDLEETRQKKAALVSVQPRVLEDERCVLVRAARPLLWAPGATAGGTTAIDSKAAPSHTGAAATEANPEEAPAARQPPRADAFASAANSPPVALGPIQPSECGDSKEVEFALAVSLGLFDYLRKSRSRGWVISLSGGADSTAVAVLCRLAVDGALRTLGSAQLAASLGVEQPEMGTAEQWAHALITCAYQSTANSGETTRGAAEAVAQALAARYLELDVQGLVDGYVSRIEAALGRRLTWAQDDIALQNIQARVRAPSVWMLANISGALLLSTSNRSEAAVGYATMDGDTSGGLCPVAGIDKAFLRRWLQWVQRQGPPGGKPLPVLQKVTSQEPTAELRPPGSAQTDESDLMPYDVLDAIEGEAIRDKRPPHACWLRLVERFPAHDKKDLGSWVIRFFTLWSRNQWKRERYAPSFHLDDKNLDPKTWCRFPILSSGFAGELEALRLDIERTSEAPSPKANPKS